MKILITSGGTFEKIDEVRKIVNNSTGQLGALIADEFAKNKEAEISYVCGENASIPENVNVKIIRVSSVDNLVDILTELITSDNFDAIIHAMAVSDYTVRGVTSIDCLTSMIAEIVCDNQHLLDCPDKLADEIRSSILDFENVNTITPIDNKKISSNVDGLVTLMDTTPKVISIIKKLQPETILVGFKLLAGADDDELLDTGHKLLQKNSCDYVLANDLNKIDSNRHEGILIEPDRSFTHLYSKIEIAKMITTKVLEKIS